MRITFPISPLFHLLCWSLVCILSLTGGDAQAKANIDQLLYFSESGQEDVYIRTSNSLKNQAYILNHPPRLVVDMAKTEMRIASPLQGYEGNLIKRVRFAQLDSKRSRLVFDLSSNTRILKKADFLDRKTRAPFIQISLLAPADTVDDKTRQEGPTPRLKPNRESEKPLIVIDAGHGGQDPGAIGPGGTHEKNVTLRIALSLRDALLESGRYRVKLTRDTDIFIRLRDRVKIARDVKGDMFISLHADSAPDHFARGLSIYTISEKASDAESEKLAERENKSDIIAGLDFSDKSEDVADILIDLAQRETRNKSAKLASVLVSEVGRKVKLLDNAQRFAGFAVLKAPDIPSVLVETGFLSNPREEKLLNSSEYQRRLVLGLVNGIDSYIRQTKQ